MMVVLRSLDDIGRVVVPDLGFGMLVRGQVVVNICQTKRKGVVN